MLERSQGERVLRIEVHAAPRIAQRAVAEQEIGIRTASIAFLVSAARVMLKPLPQQLRVMLDGAGKPCQAQVQLIAQSVGG